MKAAPQVDHAIPLPAQAVKVLKWVRELQTNASGGKPPKTTDFVFTGAKGGKLVNWSRWLRELHQTSGVKPWSPHSLRRSTATMCAELGAPPHIVAVVLGHRQIAGPLQSLYQQSRFRREHALILQQLADRIDAIVEGSDNVVQLLHGVMGIAGWSRTFTPRRGFPRNTTNWCIGNR